MRGIVCNFKGTRQCTLKGGYYGLEEVVAPLIKYHKGSMRSHLNPVKQKKIYADLQYIQQQLQQDLKQLEHNFAQYQHDLSSLFVEEKDSQALQQQVQLHIERYQLQIQDCQRLEQLCQQ